MEIEVLRNIVLVVSVLVVLVLGFFIMNRLDAFLDKNYKQYEREEKTTRIVHNENTSDEEILSDIKKLREKGVKMEIVISAQINDDDEE